MGDKSAIQWTDASWNPIRGCSRVSEGCRNCYAERTAIRQSHDERVVYTSSATPDIQEVIPAGAYHGLVKSTPQGPRWTGEVRLVPEAIDLPLRWKAPRRIFVNSMSDLFHEKVEDEWIEQIVGVIGSAPRHTFQVLTKRPERMLAWFQRRVALGWSEAPPMAYVRSGFPPRNLWLAVSVEDQATADERIPLLLQTPAAVRWASYEPALGPVDFGLSRWIRLHKPVRSELPFVDAYLPAGVYRAHSNPHGALSVQHETYDGLLGVKPAEFERLPSLDWLVVGGESGSGARPFDLAWARSAVAQCQAAGVPVFVKQLGAVVAGTWGDGTTQPHTLATTGTVICNKTQTVRWFLDDRKGGAMDEWPADLRVREYPR